MLRLVCSTTADYFDSIKPYLTTVNAFFIGEATLFCVDCEPPAGYFDDIPRVSWQTITAEQNHGAPEGTNSIQHGSFVQFFPDNDTIIYTDGDIIMQRPISFAEQVWMQRFPDGVVAAGWNSGHEEKLIHEALRLQPEVDADELRERFGSAIDIHPCFNIGVMVATRDTWQTIHNGYMEKWDLACETFAHRARQQWLVCQQLGELGIGYQVMPQWFHTHNHYGLPNGVYSHAGVACYDDRIICFRHHF